MTKEKEIKDNELKDVNGGATVGSNYSFESKARISSKFGYSQNTKVTQKNQFFQEQSALATAKACATITTLGESKIAETQLGQCGAFETVEEAASGIINIFDK